MEIIKETELMNLEDVAKVDFHVGMDFVSLRKSLSPHFNLELENSAATISARDYFNPNELMSQVNLDYHFTPYEKLSPYAFVGAGAVHRLGRQQVGLSKQKMIPYAGFGGGLEYIFSKHFAVLWEGYFNYLLNDRYDNTISGSYNDSFYGLKIGLKYYIK